MTHPIGLGGSSSFSAAGRPDREHNSRAAPFTCQRGYSAPMSPGRASAGLAAVTSLACVLAMSFTTPARGAGVAFPLDPTFAAAQPVPGVARLQLDGLPAFASHVRVYPDGSSIVALAGISPSLGYGDGRYGVAKLSPNGSLDTSFNPGGPTPGVLSTLPSEIVDIEIDSHGRILVAGYNMVTRLLADGSPDSSFVATCINPCIPGSGEPPPHAPPGSVYVNYRVYDLNVLADDSMVLESSTEINSPPFVMRLTRLTATGDRDLTFNPTDTVPGVLTIDDYGPADVLPQSDGSFLVVALSWPPRLHRVTAGGLLDMTYGGGTGVVSPPAVHDDETIWAAYPDGQDRIVLSVLVTFPSGTPSLVRINPDGTTDQTFGVAGRVDLTTLGATSVGAVFLESDDRIIIEVAQPTYENSLARLTVGGMLDASFNQTSPTPGWLLVDPAPDADHNHYIADLAQVGDGQLLAVGSRSRKPPWTPTDSLAEVYRFNGFDGAPDPIPPYPMSSPPATVGHPSIHSVIGGATATKPAVRLRAP